VSSLYITIGLTFVAFFATPVIIILVHLAGGSQTSTIYVAIIIHSQQVVNPLLYGLVFREWINAVMAQREDRTAAEIVGHPEWLVCNRYMNSDICHNRIL
jgi:predicted Na+-dependent transporter